MTFKRALVLVVPFFAACTRDKIVFRERISTPADPQAGYLGYFDASAKQTTCGNCHVDHQKRWVQTAHASAWGDLTSSGHQQNSCNSCHTLTERGNALEGSVGYD